MYKEDKDSIDEEKYLIDVIFQEFSKNNSTDQKILLVYLLKYLNSPLLIFKC